MGESTTPGRGRGQPSTASWWRCGAHPACHLSAGLVALGTPELRVPL